jgi:D-alanyl-lipoteichoic acid acyltransferase DltB (MBOAT superfamily)
MSFNSLIFLIFAAVFFALWPLMREGNSRRWSFIIVSSFIFYGWWDWRFLFLLIGTGLVDFVAALAMEKWPQNRRLFLILSLGSNISALMFFKYSGFIAENLDHLLLNFGIASHLRAQLPDFALILPVGISFYTFQSMSYTISVYWRQMPATRNILHFFAYVSMFPQLVAGPIVRAVDLLPQLTQHKSTTEEDQWAGTKLIIRGFFKKLVIADHLAPIVTAAFSSPVLPDFQIYWWVMAAAFAFQIYFDFSGYSDIARGLARWMGYDLIVNFNQPYTSISLQEFWTRWHISLSTWFRDYVYIPLGGSRLGKLRSHINMWITMLISGLWHGAAWHFVMWSVCHAFFLSIERITKLPKALGISKIGQFVSYVLVMVQVLVAWVFFRAENVAQAFQIIKIMFTFNAKLLTGTIPDGIELISMLVLFELMMFFKIDALKIIPQQARRITDPVFWALAIAATVFFRGPGTTFIYFQF